MGKNKSASNLVNVIDFNNDRIAFISGSTTLMSISSSGAVTVTGVISGSNAQSASYALNAGLLNNKDSAEFTSTGSFNAYTSSNDATVTSVAGTAVSAVAGVNALAARTSSYTTTSSFNSYTASNNTTMSCVSSTATSAIAGVGALAAQTGSYATTGSNTFDGGAYFSSSFNPTGFSTTASLYTDGGLRVSRDAYVSGTLYLNNLTVFGTQSVAYISSSQLNIGTNIISVNTDTPSVRFGGLAVYDSGSTGLTGSILWDSQNNHWVYSNPSGSSYSGGMFISGPRTSTLGSETGTTSCMLLAGQGGDHLTSSMIYHDSNATCFHSNTTITSAGAACFASTISLGDDLTLASTNPQIKWNAGNLRFTSLGIGDVVATITQAGVACFSNQICAQGATFTTTGNTAVTIAAGATGLSRLVFQGTVGNYRGFIDYDNSTCGFIIRTNESEAMRITCTGNVWIGNDSNPMLEIANGGSADVLSGIKWRVGGARDDYGGIYSAAASAYNNYITFYTRCSATTVGERMRITSGGNVGIGTTSPNTKLEVAGTIRVSSNGTNGGDWGVDDSGIAISSRGSTPIAFWTNDFTNQRMRIISTGIACFACQVCANAFIASSGIRANNGSITSCNGTVGGAAVFIADAPDNTSDIGYRVHIGGSLKWFIGLPNNVVNDNFSIFQGGCSADRLTIDTVGNVGIGTSSPVTTNLNGALTIWKCYNNDGASIPSTTAQAYYSNQSALYLFGRNSGLSIISNNNEEGKIAFGNSSSTIYASIVTGTGATSVGGDMYFKVGSDTERMRITATGISCFSCQVCVPQLVVCKTYNANNLMLSVANSTMSVPFMTYDTAIIQADDVTTLKLVERNGGSTDNQILTLSVGDNTTRISTNGPNPLQFFVGGSSAGCGYNGLGGNNAISIACSGISTFNYPVFMGNIGHYNNYRSTSGCFAIFCASQGAILYVTSMHNGGRATYQLIYSNGATGGASISLVGSTGAYGPAATSFGLCGNGWVYGYQPYGGPTDYYAINMNGTFVWAF